MEDSKSMKAIAVIPARYESTRFPGKPLAKILDKPMIQWVYERCNSVNGISDVYVATDDQRIYDCVMKFGGNAIMTGECRSGSDRIYLASKELDFDVIVNVQGDEPTIAPLDIELILGAFQDNSVVMATLKGEINEEDYTNPNVVKVITDINDNAIYFSRAAIPFFRNVISDMAYCSRHIGIYGFRKDFLERFVELPESVLEKLENLEQLRVIENGYKIKVLKTDNISVGVDTQEQIGIVEKILKNEYEEE